MISFKKWQIPEQFYEVILQEVIQENSYQEPFPKKWDSVEQGLEFLLNNEVQRTSKGEWLWVRGPSLCFLFSNSKRVVVPESITELGLGSYYNTTNSCFFQISQLEAITLPKTIKQIGKYTFKGLQEECIIDCKPFMMPYCLMKEPFRTLRVQGQSTLGELFCELMPEAYFCFNEPPSQESDFEETSLF